MPKSGVQAPMRPGSFELLPRRGTLR
jgi:hypothetical protein